MSLFDTIMSDTVGKVWEAASGTVDPWTKSNLIQEQTDAVIAAGGDAATAEAQATADVTAALSTTIDPVNGQQFSSDPSNLDAGVSRSISQIGKNLNAIATTGSRSLLYFGIGVALIAVAIYVLPVVGKAGEHVA